MSNSRNSNFSSSQVYRLMTNGTAKGSVGKPFTTYVEEKILERKLGRSLQKDAGGRPTSWGNFIEWYLFSFRKGWEFMEYTYQSDLRAKHESITNYTGAADLLTEDTVCDVKAPYSLKVFCEKSDIMLNNDIEGLKKYAPENYWQLVSNSILFDKRFAELIIYVPYFEDLIEIREAMNNYTGDMNKIAWINWAENEELPYLIKGNHYQDVCKMRWEVSENDKIALIERVKMAVELLNG